MSLWAMRVDSWFFLCEGSLWVFALFLGRTLDQVRQYGLVGRVCHQELPHRGGGSTLSLTGSGVRKPVCDLSLNFLICKMGNSNL